MSAMTSDEKLIYMANQIGDFFAAQGEARAVPGIADHIDRFWSPHMRRQFLDLAARDASELKPLVHKALPLIHGAPGVS